MKKNLFEDELSTIDDWVNTYRTNVPQLFFMTMAFLPMLQKASEHQHGYSATVINISSISGIIQSSQHHFGYNASKAAAIHVTKMLAAEVANNGLKIRVNGVAPRVFPSEMAAGESGRDQKSHIEKKNYGKVPVRRPGKDQDMAGAVLFAAANQYLNEQTVVVDRGYILYASA
jgi:NAD(P)-dependent dehydrogenase (short-subunit alcohol dehydrogenase family)